MSSTQLVPTRKTATYADVLSAPEHMVAEILSGKLVLSPRPASPHAYACTRLAMALERCGPDPRGNGSPGAGWWMIYEPELHLDSHILVPDLAGWRVEQMPEFPSAAYFEVVPEWICEVVSPSSVGRDRVQRRRIYQALGVAWYWIVDPAARMVEVLHLRQGEWISLAAAEGDEIASLPPFEHISIDLLKLWIPESPA